MKNELTEEECVTAGAWYRIWKYVSTIAPVRISNNLHLTVREQSKVVNAATKVDLIEEELGFESKCDICFPHNKDLFYGFVGAPIRSDLDHIVNRVMYNILFEVLKEIKENIEYTEKFNLTNLNSIKREDK